MNDCSSNYIKIKIEMYTKINMTTLYATLNLFV